MSVWYSKNNKSLMGTASHCLNTVMESKETIPHPKQLVINNLMNPSEERRGNEGQIKKGTYLNSSGAYTSITVVSVLEI